MTRECLQCHQRFTPHDLSKDISKKIEAERKSCGVEGILFRCYVCPSCGRENLFIDLHALEGESTRQYKERRHNLEITVKRSPKAGVRVGVTDKRPAKLPA
jgi:hypothetical protein